MLLVDHRCSSFVGERITALVFLSLCCGDSTSSPASTEADDVSCQCRGVDEGQEKLRSR